VLEHVLGQDATMPPHRGVFLTETRRMHPDICTFISEEIYEGRLTSHPSCAGQTTDVGTGLRWLRAHHAGRVTESEEEAEIVAAEIARLLGATWTNQKGAQALISVHDVIVVAPTTTRSPCCAPVWTPTRRLAGWLWGRSTNSRGGRQRSSSSA